MNIDDEPRKLTKEEKLGIIKNMIDAYEKLPAHALGGYVTHYDFLSLLILVHSLFKDS